MKRISGVFLAAIAAATMAVVFAAVAVGADVPQLMGLTPKEQVGAASQSLETSFPVLNRKSSVAIDSTFVKSIADEPLLRANGGSLALATEVKTRSGESVWLVPGDDALCLYRHNRNEFGFSGTCASVAEAREGRLSLWSTNGEGRNVHGVTVVPAGISSITVEGGDGKSAQVPAADNVAEFEGETVKSVSVGATKFDF